MFQVMVLAITAALVSLDQLTKWLAVVGLKNAEDIVLIPKVLGLHYVPNDGAGWGILSGQRILLLVVTGVVLVAILWLLLFGKFRSYPIFNVSATLIVAGGLGNFIDRLFHGYVVDFIKVLFFDFPVFNIADCYVVIGSVLLLVFFLFLYDDKKVPIASKTEETHEDDSTDRTN